MGLGFLSRAEVLEFWSQALPGEKTHSVFSVRLDDT